MSTCKKQDKFPRKMVANKYGTQQVGKGFTVAKINFLYTIFIVYIIACNIF